jgi:hypothetical protein
MCVNFFKISSLIGALNLWYLYVPEVSPTCFEEGRFNLLLSKTTGLISKYIASLKENSTKYIQTTGEK